MALPFSNTVDRTLERLRNAFVETARGAREVVGAPLRPDLPDDDIRRLKGRIDACLEGKGGETARRGRAAELGQAYLSLTPAGRKKFLLTLAHDYGLPREAAVAVVERWRASKEPPRALVRALEPPAVHLLREFVGVPQGVKFVVDLRAELLALGKSDAAARTLSEDLRPLLSAWFDVGFLDLVRIDWKASAALLEKLVDYEAVHAIRSWRDLKNRLDSDRRCFAFFHPRMPDEPLIFVEVALVDGMAGNVQRLLDARAETSDPKHANTAIFYSISNCQQGLAGISFGNFLIKRVAEQLARDLPNIRDFATLSPIPGLRQHVDGRLKNEGDGALTAELVGGAGDRQGAEADPVAAGGALSHHDRREGSRARSRGAFPSRQRCRRRAPQLARRHQRQRAEAVLCHDGELSLQVGRRRRQPRGLCHRQDRRQPRRAGVGEGLMR
jgi:malonyl-CoA decarboxylase